MSIKMLGEQCGNLSQALSREWIETNGIGGYASSTILCCHTRKYHGFLVAELHHPPGKFVLLSKYEDSLLQGKEETFLSSHIYKGAVYPGGYERQTGFEQGKTPTFKYQTQKANVTKRIALVQGENTVLTQYAFTKFQTGVKLRVKPLLAFRSFHETTHENIDMRVRTFPVSGGFKIQPYDGLPPFFLQTNGDFEFFPSPTWYRNFEYTMEKKRGFPGNEDLFCPGFFEIPLRKGTPVIVSASTLEQSDLTAVWAEEMEGRNRFHKSLKGTAFQKELKRAARQFIVDRGGQKSVIAGFPWFLEWGRDAMIALPGLFLHSQKKRPEYVQVLLKFASQVRNGLIPNFLGERENAYNSADASLWFAWAVQQYLHATGDFAGIDGPILQTVEQIFTHYVKGTDNDIKMLENGLIELGSEETQLTWMDATAYGKPVTPRHGAPVELNALWYNLVCFLGEIGARGGLPSTEDARGLAPRIRNTFESVYWSDEIDCLGDVWRDGELDLSVRPNQIFAVSLPCSPLSRERATRVVAKVRDHLLTPFGLRTLAPSEAGYRGKYLGGPNERDTAYHNGTVWPWLLCHYGEAVLKTADRAAAETELNQIIEPFKTHLEDAGLGSISEVFDGDPPHAPGGCISQAWSVAEILRLSLLLEQVHTEASQRRRRAR